MLSWQFTKYQSEIQLILDDEKMATPQYSCFQVSALFQLQDKINTSSLFVGVMKHFKRLFLLLNLFLVLHIPSIGEYKDGDFAFKLEENILQQQGAWDITAKPSLHKNMSRKVKSCTVKACNCAILLIDEYKC